MSQTLIDPFRKVWAAFEECLFPAASTASLFNPYRDRHPALDQPDAPAIRRRNLWRYLAAYALPPPIFILAEAPAPWGCRFSGVLLTSEAQLLDPDFPLSGEASGQSVRPHREYSARIYWRVMRPYFPLFLLGVLYPYIRTNPVRRFRFARLRSVNCALGCPWWPIWSRCCSPCR